MLTIYETAPYTAPMLRIALLMLAPALLSAQPKLELISTKRIWNEAPHSAFGDLIRFRDRWWCVFREGKWHVARPGQEDDGRLRVLTSKDGETWKSAAVIAEQGIDLRDPHLSIAADGRLMIVAGGSEYPKGVYQGRQPRVVFSKDGLNWTAPQAVLEKGHWLWRVTWHKGRAYGVSKYGSPSKELPENPRRADLVTSLDGIHWERITELKVPGADETTLRFLPDGRLIALMRRVWNDGNIAWIGESAPPTATGNGNQVGTLSAARISLLYRTTHGSLADESSPTARLKSPEQCSVP